MKSIQLIVSALLWATVHAASLRKTGSSETLAKKTDRLKRMTSPTQINGSVGLVLTQGLYQSHQEAASERAENAERIARNTQGAQRAPNQMFLNMMVAPEVNVTVENGGSSETISVALAPDMSTFDAIQAAKTLYAHRNTGAMHNPFSATPMVHRSADVVCAIISSMDGVEAIWMVSVMNGNDEVIHQGRCIPSRSTLLMRPGYSIRITSA